MDRVARAQAGAPARPMEGCRVANRAYLGSCSRGTEALGGYMVMEWGQREPRGQTGSSRLVTYSVSGLSKGAGTVR